MNLKGKLIEINETQLVSNTFEKREFVVEYAENPQYPEYIKLEAIQDKCALLDKFKVNQDVSVEFNLKGRKWTDAQGQTKYFNSLQAWKIEAIGVQSNAIQSAPKSNASEVYNNIPDEDSDDLPF
jgi:hypothetical protein